MFKKLTKFLVSQMDANQEMVPVESIAENQRFRPLSLLINKSKPSTTFHPYPYYQWTGFTLDDVLLPGKDGKRIDFVHEDPCPFTITLKNTGEAEGGLVFSISPVNGKAGGGYSSSEEFSVTPQKKSVELQSLEELSKERQVNMDHSLIQQLQRTDLKLFVVIESFEASKDAVYKESTKKEWGFWAWIWALIWGKGTNKEEQTIVISKGCTLAFRAIQMEIRKGAWDLNYLPAESIRTTISTLACTPQRRFGVVMEEVKNHCQIFPELSPRLMLIVLNTIKAAMRDNNLLQELSQKMEDVSEKNYDYELKTESPDLKDLFSTLQQSPRDHHLPLAEGITYILDALHELTEVQLQLLLVSLERKIVFQQLRQVENLLKHGPEKQMVPFGADVELVSFPYQKQLNIFRMLLGGVGFRENASVVPRHQPFEDMVALFVALYALNLLSGSGQTWQRESLHNLFRNY